ncbi:MAG: Gfo/Idh/MocA family oxidoreductase [Kiritimatiellae bacterium]|nr:Gfo/Idh/MocA family oxidoreductase [Kiritimatiellia bacterium]
MKISRRNFLNVSAATAAVSAFNIVPANVLGQNAPSNRISMAMVGVGGMGTGNMNTFLGQRDVQVKVVCDVNTKKMDSAKQRVDGHYKNSDCEMIKDYREACSRADIDAIMIGTPDHWHAYIGTFAARHGKDIYGEKPFTHDLLEGRALVNAIKQHGRVWQTGSWQRSSGEMQRAVELVRNGRIGKISRVEVGLPGGGRGRAHDPNQPVPEGLDWDMWLGPAPYRKFMGVYDWDWRWVLDWGGGQMMDWIGHHADIAQWGLGKDLSGPSAFTGYCAFAPQYIYDSPTSYRYTGTYDDGVEIVVADSGQVRSGTKWYGENGAWVWVDRGRFDASSSAIRDSKIEAGEIRFRSVGHQREFIDCVKSRDTTLTPAEVAHRSASIGHLGQIAMLTGRRIAWNPETEQIIGDPAATAMLGRAPRGPWALT